MPLSPLVFVSHGSPELALRATPAHGHLRTLGRKLTPARAILVVSAHWTTHTPMVACDAAPRTVYDFGGFDPRLRQIRYDAPAALDVADTALALLRAAGLDAGTADHVGYDHGVWVPLSLMAPDASLPVAQVSVQPDRDPTHHHEVGRALAKLREDGVAILASGALTHNLMAFRGQPVDAPVPGWVSTFNDWLAEAVAEDRLEDLLDYRRRAPHGADNHPTDEHLLPFFVALGARAPGETFARTHASYEHGILAMDVYASAMAA
ncbi:MAG: dioxygenase [Rhizobiales bacterium]|nr:dioxygenase [Hyphomicrobiales bacterium]